MVSTLNIVSMVIGLVISVGTSITILIILAAKRKGAMHSVLLGAITFAVSQLLLRAPVTEITSPALNSLSNSIPIVYALVLALMAAFFEEGGKFIGMKLGLKDSTRFVDGVGFGLGFAGLKALLFTGMNFAFSINAAMAANSGGMLGDKDISQVRQVYEQLASAPWYQYILLGLNDVFWLAIQITLSVLLVLGIKRGTKQSLAFLGICMLAHLLMEGVTTIMTTVIGLSKYVAQGYVGVLGVAAVVFLIFCKKKDLFLEREEESNRVK